MIARSSFCLICFREFTNWRGVVLHLQKAHRHDESEKLETALLFARENMKIERNEFLLRPKRLKDELENQ